MLLLIAGCKPPVETPDDGSSGVGSSVGRKAPEIIATTIDGKPFRLSELKGKVVVLDFWATWCGPCVRAMPAMKRLHEKYKDQPFALIGISVDHEREPLSRFVSANGIGWPQIYDEDDIGTRWGVDSIPRVFILDQDGVIRYLSPMTEAQIERAVKNLLSDLAARS